MVTAKNKSEDYVLTAIQSAVLIGGLTEIQKQLRDIIDCSGVNIVFQPIVSLRDGSVLGYEALSRGPAGTALQNPDAMFRVAEESGMLWDLEQLCRTRALEAVYSNHCDVKLFLNVNPHTIHDEKFKLGFTKEYLSKFHINPENIHFEISEKGAVQDMSAFRNTIEHYKNQHYKIAIDDAGAGYAGLGMITDIHPHYIKLDMKLIHKINQDSYKKALVKSLYDFSRLAGISLIAEGIETESELKTLIEIGVQFGQGFFIQRPEDKLRPTDEAVINAIHSCNEKKNHYYRSLSNFYIGNLGCSNPTVFPEDRADEVYNLFLADDNLSGLTAVAHDGSVAGIITRTNIVHIMSGQYGYSLHAKRPVSMFMDKSPLITDHQVSIDTASKLAMSRPVGRLYDMIVVTQNNMYQGVVTIKNLLEKTMEIEVTNARLLNPLSGLPGNLIIESCIEKCLIKDAPFTVIYADIDNFKAYNDTYGFGNGDKVIRFTAKLMEEVFTPENFVGHIGGDDFVAVVQSGDVEQTCQKLIDRFDAGIPEFYSSKDLERGYVETRDRRGDNDRFPLMSLSVAGISSHNRTFKDISSLSEYAGAIKKKCKLIWESCYLIE